MSINLSINKADVVKLLHECYRREAAAQAQLYHQYYPFARHVALNYADDESGAEDIVQDAFIKLFRHLEKGAFSGDFEKFLRRVIVNTGIDHYRARSARQRLTERFTHSLRKQADNAAPEEMEAQDVHRFLQQLPPRYRMVFSLFVMEEYSHPEIAKRLGISVGTSKSNLAKARKSLRKLAGPYFQL
jgi:RNA polymerase sigma-70 factor (ECF subfamily)